MTASRITTDVDYDKRGKQSGYLQVPHSSNESAYGYIPIPITVVKGGSGPTVYLSGGVHGDEYEGPVTLMKLARTIKASDVAGRVIILPATNLPAVLAGMRCSPIDGLNLNRVFPGSHDGSVTMTIAHYVSTVLLPLADIAIDLHSGGKTLEYIPTIIMNRTPDKARERATLAALKLFGLPIGTIDDKTDHGGLFEMECEALGILNLNTELGGAGRVTKAYVEMAEWGVANVLRHFGVLKGKAKRPKTATRILSVDDPRSHLFAPDGGLFEPFIELGDTVKKGAPVGQVHFAGQATRAPWVVHSEIAGTMLLKRPPGRVEQGDNVAIIAIDV